MRRALLFAKGLARREPSRADAGFGGVNAAPCGACAHALSSIKVSVMKTPSIDLKSNTKNTVNALLNAELANALDLSLAVKQAHWNLKGMQFIAVHEMLDDLRAELDVHTDTIAERVAQLDGVALGTSQVVAKATTLAPYPTDIKKVPDHLAAVAERYAAAAKSARAAIDTADEAGDAGTADILTAYSRALDKSLWFVKSHLE